MRKFVMGDLHGAEKALNQCLGLVSFDYDHDVLIQLGDVVDGFPEAYEVVEHLLRIRNLIAIKGNHDDWFLEFLSTGHHPDQWAPGSRSTALSYLKHAGKPAASGMTIPVQASSLTPDDVPERHKSFFRNQQLYYTDEEKNCFVHAGFDRHRPFVGQRTEEYIWDRELWADALSWSVGQLEQKNHLPFETVTEFNAIFIGHTATLNWGLDKPMKAANIYNLDTGAGHYGRLTIMEVATKKYWQSDSVEELYKHRAEQYTG